MSTEQEKRLERRVKDAEPGVVKPLGGMEAAERFLAQLNRGENRPFCWRTFVDAKGHKGAGKNLEGSLADVTAALAQRQNQGHGVYVVVNIGGHTDESITDIRAVFIDRDNGVPLSEAKWHLEPHFIVVRDETHYHAYWLVDIGALTRAQFTEAQHRLAAHYDSDSMVTNPSRVMRVPGYLHQKDGQKNVTLIELADAERMLFGLHTFDEVMAGLDPLPDWFDPSTYSPHPLRHRPLCDLDLPENIELAVTFLATRDPAIENGTGNRWTYETACMIRDYGISDTECARLMHDSEWNLEQNRGPWSLDELLDRTGPVTNAYRYGQNRAGSKRNMMVDFRRKRGGQGADIISLHAGQGLPGGEVPSTAPDDTPRQEPPERRPFKLRTEADQDNQPPPDWLVPGVLQRETLAMFMGRENSFKTFLVMDLCLSAAACKPWAAYSGCEKPGGYCADKPLIVVHYAGEGARGIETLRRPAWRKHHGITTPLSFYTVNEMPIFKSAADVDAMIAEIEAAGIMPDIIVIDTAARAMLDLDENSTKDTGIFIAACDRLKRRFKCAVIVVHHTGKDERKGARGSTNLPASFDARFKVSGDTTSLVASIRNEKQKDGEPWSKPITFQGERVRFDDGRTSLVFIRTAPDADANGEDDPRQNLALKIIADNKGKMSLSMNAMAEEMARRNATEELTDGDLKMAKEGMRNYLKKAVTGGLAPYAHKSGAAKNAPWEFEDRFGWKGNLTV